MHKRKEDGLVVVDDSGASAVAIVKCVAPTQRRAV